MTYIGLIKAFWRSQEEHSFGPTEVALYLYLLEVCNICHWKNPFKRNNAKIEADLSMSYHTLKNARNRLKACGLIDFKTISGSSNVVYTLTPTSEINYEVSYEVPNEVPNEVSYEVSYEVLPTKERQDKDKDKDKTIPPLSPCEGEAEPDKTSEAAPLSDKTPAAPGGKRKSCAKKKSSAIDLSFVEPTFQPIVADWLAYKSERGQTYREQGAKACYTRLRNISGGDPNTARSIVEQSKANNWSGLFELKQQPAQHDTRTTNRRTLPDNPVYRSDVDF